MNSSIEIVKINGDDINNYLQDLAELRIKVFREYPYLYRGSISYEIEYLQPYQNAPDATFFIVKDNQKVVGASTCIPLVQEDEVFQEPFRKNKIDRSCVMYFGESVLLKKYRGLGLGKEFFSLREACATDFKNIEICTFCAVDRPLDHPLKPENYKDLHGFWLSMGYRQHPELTTCLSWQDIDQPKVTSKKMIFWLKKIR